jgi:hypothetical protein
MKPLSSCHGYRELEVPSGKRRALFTIVNGETMALRRFFTPTLRQDI